jgi:hypothetical protein
MAMKRLDQQPAAGIVGMRLIGRQARMQGVGHAEVRANCGEFPVRRGAIPRLGFRYGAHSGRIHVR